MSDEQPVEKFGHIPVDLIITELQSDGHLVAASYTEHLRERLGEAESILTALANSPAPTSSDGGYHKCGLCYDGPITGLHSSHDPSCPWRRARELQAKESASE